MNKVKEFVECFKEYLKGRSRKEKIEILLATLITLDKEIKKKEA